MEQEKLPTFDDLRHMFCTGRSQYLSGSGRDKKYTYRHGVMTKLGDIEESKWKEMMYNLISRSGEMELFNQLYAWATDCCPWLHTKKEVEMYALELHSARIFENPQWVALKQFNEQYRGIKF